MLADMGEILQYMIDESTKSFNFEALGRTFPMPSDRRTLIDLAELMLEADREVQQGEIDFVRRLKRALAY